MLTLRRSAAVFMITACFTALLFGCATGKNQISADEISSVISAPFSANVAVTCRGKEYSAELIKTADSIDVHMTAPALFNGMEISFTDDSAVVIYNGLTFSLDPSRLPASAAIKSLVAALNNATVPDEFEVDTLTDGELTINGNGFTIYTVRDDSSGTFTVKQIDIPEQELTALFSDFTPAA